MAHTSNMTESQKRKGPAHRSWLQAALCFAVLVFAVSFSNPAFACGPACSCVPPAHETTNEDYVAPQHDATRQHITDEFDDHERVLMYEIYRKYILPAWMMMAEQLTVTAMQQMLAVGSFFDAKVAMESQRTFQKLTAEAHKDYHPSFEMCVIGTTIRSLADSERDSEYTTFVLSQRSIDRQMGNVNSLGSIGNISDAQSRLSQFSGSFCSFYDNAFRKATPSEQSIAWVSEVGGFNKLCDSSGPADKQNRDIDFAQTISRHGTLDVDLKRAAVTTDELSVFAMANNLYGSNLLFRLPEAVLKDASNHGRVLDMRSLIAKRAVAEHSFYNLVGIKSKSGTNISQKDSPPYGTAPYFKALLKSLGMQNDDIHYYLGTEDPESDDPNLRPSYDIQMKILTQKVYQNPDFYVSLYDKPVNVDRRMVALQAIGLMQDFDTWKSHLRTEAMLSVVLELELIKLQNTVQEAVNRI